MSKRTVSFLCLLLALPIASLCAPSTSAAPADDWQELFNGKDLQGWKLIGEGQMSVQNGLLKAGGEGTGLLYWTGGKLGDCVLRVVFRMQHENDNSGVYIRIPVEPREESMPDNYGYEINIDNHPERWGEDDYHVTGAIYSFTKALAQPWKPGPQWNTMDITLDGPHTIVVLNGVKVTDYTEGDPARERKPGESPYGRRPDQGWIGLQGYNANEIVLFKRVAVKPLHAKK